MSRQQRSDQNEVDVFMSHDWPSGIAHFGDRQKLFRQKSFLRQEIERFELGSPPAALLLAALRPKYWLSAHMHVRFPATVRWTKLNSPANDSAPPSIKRCRIDSSVSSASDQQQQQPDHAPSTEFLALDKALDNRQFASMITIDKSACDTTEAEERIWIEWDPLWLSTICSCSPAMQAHNVPAQFQQIASRFATAFAPTHELYDNESVKMALELANPWAARDEHIETVNQIPNFQVPQWGDSTARVVTSYQGEPLRGHLPQPERYEPAPITRTLLEMLHVPDPLGPQQNQPQAAMATAQVQNSEEIEL